jgi:hypothetical protein
MEDNTYESKRLEILMAEFPNASLETLECYIDLRSEGHPRWKALILAGLSDPEEEES